MLDWLRDFQQSFREPVYGFLGIFWPVPAVMALIGLGWLFGSLWRRAGRSSSSDGGGSGDFSVGDSDGGGDGGGD